jgi:uncharacterized protein YqeY
MAGTVPEISLGAALGRPVRSGPVPAPAPPALPDRLRQDLKQAMKDRDRPAVAALRQTLAAIANAEAPALPDTQGTLPTEPVLGRANEVDRRALTDADVARIVAAELAERERAADEYARLDRPDEAAAVTAEATILRRYLV